VIFYCPIAITHLSLDPDVPLTRNTPFSTGAKITRRPRLPRVSQPEQEVGAVVQAVGLITTAQAPQLTLCQLRAKYPGSRPTWEQESRSSKRAHAEVDGTTDRRSPSYSVPASVYMDIKGKRKMVTSQSPAFRLDNLLESSPVEDSRPGASSSTAGNTLEPPTSEPRYARAPLPVFTGKLPPTPFTGSSALGPAPHISIAGLGITVSKHVTICDPLSFF
jgi:hypothetical protein